VIDFTPFFSLVSGAASLMFPLYELITSCPIPADDDDKHRYKHLSLNTTYKDLVTSSATNYSYMYEYCAVCPGEDKRKTTIWNFSGGVKNQIPIFNFVDSIEMLQNTMRNMQTTVTYSPPKNLQSIVPPFHACNVLPTPTCHEHEDLQAACLSSYIN
jgi:hypothetical protein